MSQPVKQDLTCYRGQTYTQNVYFKKDGIPLPMDSYTPKAQIRPSENSPSLTAEFDCFIDSELGMLSLCLSSETTSRIPPGKYVWDLKMVSGNNVVDYWLKGSFIVTGRVTE